MPRRRPDRASENLSEPAQAGDPLVLFNAWERAAPRWSRAPGEGDRDGELVGLRLLMVRRREKLPFDLALASLERIVAAVHLPYPRPRSGIGRSPQAVSETVPSRRGGAIGQSGRSDHRGTGSTRRPTRLTLRAARAPRIVRDPLLHQRETDVFLKADKATHVARSWTRRWAAPRRTRRRAQRFLRSGPRREGSSARLQSFSDAGHVLILPTSRLPRASRSGRRAISHGPAPYRLAMKPRRRGREAYAPAKGSRWFDRGAACAVSPALACATLGLFV